MVYARACKHLPRRESLVVDDYHKLSARLRHHAHAKGTIEDFKKFPARLDEVAGEKAIDFGEMEIWSGMRLVSMRILCTMRLRRPACVVRGGGPGLAGR
jgi:hypothetical protein